MRHYQVRAAFVAAQVRQPEICLVAPSALFAGQFTSAEAYQLPTTELAIVH